MSYDSIKSECDILVVTDFVDQAEKLSEKMRELGLNLKVEHCLSVPKALASKLARKHPRVVLYKHPDKTNGRDLMESARDVVDEAIRPARDISLMECFDFNDLFGNAVVIATSISERSSAEKSGKKTFLWPSSPDSELPTDSAVLDLAMLTDHNKTMIGIRDKIRPLLNHRLRRELLIIALEARGTTDAKNLALKLTGEPGDEPDKQILSKACRLVRICAVNFHKLFMGIVFTHGNFGIPLFDAVWEKDFDAVKMMLDEVNNDIVAEDKDGEHLLSIAVSRALESPGNDASLKIVQLLLQRGFDVSVVMKGWKKAGGNNALEIAENRGNENLAQLLRKYGAVE